MATAKEVSSSERVVSSRKPIAAAKEGSSSELASLVLLGGVERSNRLEDFLERADFKKCLI